MASMKLQLDPANISEIVAVLTKGTSFTVDKAQALGDMLRDSQQNYIDLSTNEMNELLGNLGNLLFLQEVKDFFMFSNPLLKIVNSQKIAEGAYGAVITTYLALMDDWAPTPLIPTDLAIIKQYKQEFTHTYKKRIRTEYTPAVFQRAFTSIGQLGSFLGLYLKRIMDTFNVYIWAKIVKIGGTGIKKHFIDNTSTSFADAYKTTFFNLVEEMTGIPTKKFNVGDDIDMTVKNNTALSTFVSSTKKLLFITNPFTKNFINTQVLPGLYNIEALRPEKRFKAVIKATTSVGYDPDTDIPDYTLADYEMWVISTDAIQLYTTVDASTSQYYGYPNIFQNVLHKWIMMGLVKFAPGFKFTWTKPK